ncbi:hypothetical protein FQA39_LY15192 [Lamprigera yunnana]|nr:hypothetical protein FQA39_LY15192 [Lamprigera yunnana]
MGATNFFFAPNEITFRSGGEGNGYADTDAQESVGLDPEYKKKQSRAPRNWAQEVHELMEARDLQDGDWLDKKSWRAGCEIRLSP